MKKFNTTPISGMQELLPGLQTEFNRLKSGIEAAYHSHGFQSIETPTIDRMEVLLAKAGGDTEKQIYKVVKTAETADDADQALRFDHTVPLARYVVEHANDLAFPFKVTQIGRNFRGERTQKGRFREFYQCDADVIGWGQLPIAYDADVIETLVDALKVLPLDGKFLVRISNRKILQGLLESLNLEHLAKEIFGIIDHAEKVSPEKTVSAFEELGIGSENVVVFTTFIGIKGRGEEVFSHIEQINCSNEKFSTGIAELREVMDALEARGLGEVVTVDLGIVRGLDYYTGTVFETIVPGHRELGSICGGGRYENLASNYTDQPMPGVGGSIGLTRLFFILRECGMIQNLDNIKPVDVCVVPLSSAELSAASSVAEKLRRDYRSVDVVATDRRLGDKLTYAAKIARFVLVLGADEIASGTAELKDLVTGEKTPVKISD